MDALHAGGAVNRLIKGADMTTATPGAQGYPDDFAVHAPQQAPPKRKRTGLWITIAIVLVLAIGGGAFAVVRALSGGGDQPADALPAESVAYARLDIDPSLGQKVAALEFLDSLDPEVKEILESTDIREAFFDEITAGSPGLSGIDYENDIDPWLGDRLGVGVIPDPDSTEAIVAVALQVTDEDAADESIERLVSELGGAGSIDWFFHGDYAVFTEGPYAATVEAMVNEGTLADTDNFQSDHEQLGDQGVASFWADLDAIGEAAGLDNAASDISQDYPGATGMAGLLTGSDELNSGRLAAAVRLGDNHIEIHGVAHGHEEAIQGGDSPQVILDLPEDTFAALGVEHGDQWVDVFWTTFNEAAPDELAQIQQEAQADGIELPGDAKAIAGQSAAVAVGPSIIDYFYGTTDQPDVAVKVSTEGIDRVDEIMSTVIAEEMGAGSEFPYVVDGDTYTAGSNQAYVDAVSSGGSLGDSDLFRNAVPNADGADLIGYVDITALHDTAREHLSHDPDFLDIVTNMGALGFSAESNGTESEFTIRLVGTE